VIGRHEIRYAPRLQPAAGIWRHHATPAAFTFVTCLETAANIRYFHHRLGRAHVATGRGPIAVCENVCRITRCSRRHAMMVVAAAEASGSAAARCAEAACSSRTPSFFLETSQKSVYVQSVRRLAPPKGRRGDREPRPAGEEAEGGRAPPHGARRSRQPLAERQLPRSARREDAMKRFREGRSDSATPRLPPERDIVFVCRRRERR